MRIFTYQSAAQESYRRGDEAFKYSFGTIGRAGIVTEATLELETLAPWEMRRKGNRSVGLAALASLMGTPAGEGCT